MAERTLGILVKADGAAKAAGLIGQVDKSVQKLGTSSGLSRFTTGLGRAGKAAGGLLTSIGPLLGVAGIAGIGAAFGSSLTEAANFGANVSKVAGVTNLAAEDASAMVDTLDKWGVSSDRLIPMLGKLEKNVGALVGTSGKQGSSAEAVTKATENLRVAQLKLHEVENKRGHSTSSLVAAQYRVADAQRKLTAAQKTGTISLDGAAKFQKQYGVSLLDNKGKIADANTLLLRSADYFNSNASATDKATFMSKLWGKAWQDMIPILLKGSKFIKDQEASAIHLTGTQVSNIDKFRNAQREFADTMGDLQVKLGAELMPMITSALQEASTWLDSHSDEVVQFFKGAADFGAQLAQGARAAFGAIKAGWDLIPGPLKTLLIEGLVAGKVSKFLFDVGPMDIAKGLVGGIGDLAGSIFKRGGSPATPLFVSDVTGGLGGAAAAAGGIGLGTVAIASAAAAAVGLLIAGGEGAFGKGSAIPGVTGSEIVAGGGVGKFGSSNRPVPVRIVGDFGAPHPGSTNAGSSGRPQWSVLAEGADARKNQAMQAILQRATAAGFRPTQAAVTKTYDRDVERHTALIAQREAELKTAVKNVAPAVVSGIVGAIRGLGQPIVNVNVTASDIVRIQNQRRRTVKPHGPRGSLVGANEFG